MSYACTVEPLRAANLLSRRPLYNVVHLGEEDAGSSGAASVQAARPLAAPGGLDLVLVVAGGDPFQFDDPRVFEGLQGLTRRGVAVGGVSGGSVILAKAGLMAGRRMTVHWDHAAELAELYPELLIERRLYVIDRDRVTCGGGIAPLDLMHALIARQHGGPFARLVSDWFLHTDIRAATAPQRAGLAERLGSRSPHVLEAVAAMESHIGDPLSLTQLALVAGVTPRHLNRLFAEAFGQSVATYYRDLRLALGRRLVRTSAQGIAEIADATGFGTPGHFSNAYKAQFGLRPSADRRAP
ncbi:MAG: helix-turn-helix domain-containing protein [Pseudomonadota bacterium]